MEGLEGTAIRLAVRDLSCPQGPGPGWNSKAPVSVRGPSCRWQRPPLPIAASGLIAGNHPRRVAPGTSSRDGGRGPDLNQRIKSQVYCADPPPPPRSPEGADLIPGLSVPTDTPGIHPAGRPRN